MASLNESMYSSPSAKRALNIHSKRIEIAENVRKNAGKAPLTYEQKLAMGVCLENTRQSIKINESLNYGGAVQPSNIGQ